MTMAFAELAVPDDEDLDDLGTAGTLLLAGIGAIELGAVWLMSGLWPLATAVGLDLSGREGTGKGAPGPSAR